MTQRKPHIWLLDSDVASRQSVYRFLVDQAFHVEPFDSFSEFAKYFNSPRLLLVHDTETLIADLVQNLDLIGGVCPFAAFSRDVESSKIVDAVRMGALDYFCVDLDELSMGDRILQLHSSLPKIAKQAREVAGAKKRIQGLTARELQILECVSIGMPNRVIAEKYAISPRTVEVHRKNMNAKLGVCNSLGAAKIAAEAGLIS